MARRVSDGRISCGWGGLWGLNPRHSVPQTDALPTELNPPHSKGNFIVAYPATASAVSRPIQGCKFRQSYRPDFFHNSSTRRLTSADISITPGQGRVNPSPGHLRVASIPIFEP